MLSVTLQRTYLLRATHMAPNWDFGIPITPGNKRKIMMQINDDFCVSFVYLFDSHYYMDDTVL